MKIIDPSRKSPYKQYNLACFLLTIYIINTDVIPPYNLLFTTTPVKLILHGILLSGICQVNVLGGGGGG